VRKPVQNPRPEVNLTPVLGLVAILIPMLLMAYAPQVLAVIDSEPPALCGGSCAAEPGEESVTPRVLLTARGITLEDVVMETGEDPSKAELPCTGACRTADDYDWEAVQEALALTRAETEGSGQVAIVPTDDVPYDVVVQSMDACRERVFADGTTEPLYPFPVLGALGEG